MAITYTTSTGYTDTTISGASDSLTLPVINWKSDFAVKSDSQNTVELTNIQANSDQPETVKFSISDIKNIYTNNTDIDPTMYGPSKRGKSLLLSVQDTVRVEASNGEVMDYPIQCHTVIKFPVSAAIDSTVLQAIYNRCVALSRATVDVISSGVTTPTTQSIINRLSKGALNPTDINGLS